MHPEVLEFVRGHASHDPIRVLDIGGRDVNGSPRGLFPRASWTVLDKFEHPSVDIVADAATWDPNGRRFDLVLCTEVFEHTPCWREICATAFSACCPGGRFVATCASGGRAPHGAHGAAGVEVDEHYANVGRDELAEALQAAGWADVRVDAVRGGLDLQATAVKR